jgi:hypothetical protein
MELGSSKQGAFAPIAVVPERRLQEWPGAGSRLLIRTTLSRRGVLREEGKRLEQRFLVRRACDRAEGEGLGSARASISFLPSSQTSGDLSCRQDIGRWCCRSSISRLAGRMPNGEYASASMLFQACVSRTSVSCKSKPSAIGDIPRNWFILGLLHQVQRSPQSSLTSPFPSPCKAEILYLMFTHTQTP